MKVWVNKEQQQQPQLPHNNIVATKHLTALHCHCTLSSPNPFFKLPGHNLDVHEFLGAAGIPTGCGCPTHLLPCGRSVLRGSEKGGTRVEGASGAEETSRFDRWNMQLPLQRCGSKKMPWEHFTGLLDFQIERSAAPGNLLSKSF